MESLLHEDLSWVYLLLQNICEYVRGKIKTGPQVQPEANLTDKINYTLKVMSKYIFEGNIFW